MQIDAAINPGNSGGPAVVNDKMIGLAFSRLSSSENIGYIIPNEEIELFLADIADGHYDGKPAIVDDFQTLQNPALREFLKLDKSAHGVVVHEPYTEDDGYPLKKWDVITRIGDKPVDDEGMIQVNDQRRVLFKYMAQKIAKDGKVPLSIIRASKEMRIDLPVEAKHPTVISDLEGGYPSYFIYGPMVFSTATIEFIGGFSAANRQWLSTIGSQLMSRLNDKPAFPGESLVVVSSPFFPHKLSEGYNNPIGEVVTKVNGIPVRNLAQLVEALRDSTEKYMRFEFDQRTAETLVFPRSQMVSATDEILNDNGVRSQGSPDMMAIWNHARTSK